MTTSLSSAATASALQALKPSPRMPVLFVGHGSPMNAIEDNAWRRSWQAMGAELMARAAQPQLILCVSAHWLTRGGWQLTGMANPKTIHDFGGFPQARIPVMQLSMDYSRAPAEHYALGQQLKALRERGVLIVGSGNIVHNLRLTRRGTAATEAYDWAAEFDTVVQEQIKKGQLGALQDFQKLGAVAQQAHPTHEHYLPLLYAAGAVESSEMPRFFNTGYQSASISMRSVLWG